MMEKKSLIPLGANMAFKEVRYEVWKWEQELYDGSKTIFERIRRSDSVNVIAVVADKIIVQKQEQPGWFEPLFTLPGGVADSGNTPLEEAKRELLEETGYISDDWVLWKTHQHFGVIFTSYIFVARDCKKIDNLKLDAGEKIENTPVIFEEFLRLAEDPKFREHEVATELLYVRLDKEKEVEFKKLLFSL